MNHLLSLVASSRNLLSLFPYLLPFSKDQLLYCGNSFQLPSLLAPLCWPPFLFPFSLSSQRLSEISRVRMCSMVAGQVIHSIISHFNAISDSSSSLVITKCKESVQDGHHLENISWWLWYCKLIQAQVSYQPPTPELTMPHSKDK